MRIACVLMVLLPTVLGCSAARQESMVTQQQVRPTLEIRFTGAEVLVQEKEQNGTVSAVWVLAANLESATHPHFAQLRFGCDASAEQCMATVDLRNVEVEIDPPANGDVTVDASYDLIEFDGDLGYGAPDPRWTGGHGADLATALSSRLELTGGTLRAGGDKCPYAFEPPGGTPVDYVERRTYAAHRRDIPAGGFTIRLKDLTDGTEVRTIPIADLAEPWLYGNSTDQAARRVILWLVNDPGPWHRHAHLEHFLDTARALGANQPRLVPHVDHPSCVPVGPASGTAFCPPSEYP